MVINDAGEPDDCTRCNNGFAPQSSTPTGGALCWCGHGKDEHLEHKGCRHHDSTSLDDPFYSCLCPDYRPARALGSPGERDDRAAKSVRVEWEDGLYTEIRGTTARGIVQFLATVYGAPGETTDTRANVVKCVCGLTLTVACPCCGAPRGEPCKHHGSALASPSPQTHDEGDRT